MIALWLVYLLAFGVVLSAAAACLERALRLAGRPARGVWAVAIGATLLAPAVAAVAPREVVVASSAATTVAPAAAPSANTQALAALLARAAVRDVAGDRWTALDRPLVVGAVVAALLGVAWLARSLRRLRRAARAWEPATVAGEPVLIAPDAGPAAVGDGGGRIVLPRWALALGDERLALMLAHERSHLAARDPQLLLWTTAAVALMPWHPALWWQLQRLRLAVELDCDRRVLRRFPNVPAYGALLLDVARRAPFTTLGLSAAFSAPTPATSLERRIRLMTGRRPRHALARALGFVALGTALVVAACETPRPTEARPERRVPLASLANASPEAAPQDGGVALAKIRAALANDLKQMTSTHANRVFIVAESGRVQTIETGRADGGVKAPLAERVTRHFDANGTVARVEVRRGAADPASETLTSLDGSSIKSVEVVKLAPGRLTPDSVSVIWIEMKRPGEARTVAPDTGDAPTSTQPPAEQPARVRVRQTAEASGGPVLVVDGKMTLPTPRIIIDGVVADSGATIQQAMGRIPTDSIETVEVLKGAAAEALYGPKARDGVIVVTTKRAKAQRP